MQPPRLPTAAAIAATGGFPDEGRAAGWIMPAGSAPAVEGACYVAWTFSGSGGGTGSVSVQLRGAAAQACAVQVARRPGGATLVAAFAESNAFCVLDVLGGRCGEPPRLQGRLCSGVGGGAYLVHGGRNSGSGPGAVAFWSGEDGDAKLADEVSAALARASGGALTLLRAADADSAAQLLEEGAVALVLDPPRAAERREQCRAILAAAYGAAVVFSAATVDGQMLRLDAWSWGARYAATTAEEAAAAVCAITGLGERPALPPPPGLVAGTPPLVIGISGPSRSGKSTLAAGLCSYFKRAGWHTWQLGGAHGLDRYFAKHWIFSPDHGAGDYESPGGVKHWHVSEDFDRAVAAARQHVAKNGSGGSVLIVEGFRAFWDPVLVEQMHVRFELRVAPEEAERRRVQTKGGERIRGYFRSHIWPTHCAYVGGAVARTPMVAFLSGEGGEDATLRAALTCPRLACCLGGEPLRVAAQGLVAAHRDGAVANATNAAATIAEPRLVADGARRSSERQQE